MKVEFQDSFVLKLNRQVQYIAKDKPKAARKFKNALLDQCKRLPKHPYLHKKSIYFNREDIRDLPFKGYTVVYKVNESNNLISIFALLKFEEEIS